MQVEQVSLRTSNGETEANQRRHDDNMNTFIDQTSSNSTQDMALEPFVHQVTGRSHMLSLNTTTVCKSLLPRELLFYNSLPEALRPFTPEVKGVLYAQLQCNEKHEFTPTELFVKSSPRKVKETHSVNGHGNHIMQKNYKETLFKGLERVEYDKINGFNGHSLTIDKDQEAITEAVGANPWAVRQHQREINRMLARDTTINSSILMTNGGTFPIPEHPGKFLRGYMMLEDVTAHYIHPNVLDLKLGKQIERDDCSEAKKNKHVQLVNNCSTGEIAMRMAGMQVYQVNTGHYLCRDKYYGRGLTKSGFYELFKLFFHNGDRTVTEVIPGMIGRLEKLKEVIAMQDTFRFYASSLLIIYEGAEQSTNKIDVRMIDFAHSTFKDFNGDKNVQTGPDPDCLDAFTNLIAFLKLIHKEDS